MNTQSGAAAENQTAKMQPGICGNHIAASESYQSKEAQRAKNTAGLP